MTARKIRNDSSETIRHCFGYSSTRGIGEAICKMLSGNRDAMVREKTWQNLMAETPTFQSSTFEVVAQFLSRQQKLALINDKEVGLDDPDWELVQFSCQT
ncbi:hypothetical protein [Marinobacter metalliresistant]|uniref:Uncharacterized protein n=1 Tax=Marinobacter metalliresistant TaxID=2961995 RepID=A0ABZ2W315_9GAMM